MVPLNAAETEWVATNVAAVRQMLVSSGLSADGALSPEALDDLWAVLLDEETRDPNEIINLVGLSFGQLLTEQLDLAWVALTDAHGTEIAVRGRSDFTVFPTVFVAKRYAERETHFLAASFRDMVRTVESII